MSGARSRGGGSTGRLIGAELSRVPDAAGRGEQDRLVAEAHREVADEVDLVPAARRTPLHVGGPSGHPGQVRLQVGNPGVAVDSESRQRLRRGVLGALG